ncbi:hypothetical protein QIS74_07792 [Colletotrichum tabaci]|uniref:Uncharacterized protein n=1 Tax=Colletotrichum tabaci TaxID=1209068 RepID=A0AAV9T6T8_9PEZI
MFSQIPSATIVTSNAARKSQSPFAPQLSPSRFLADSCANLFDVLITRPHGLVDEEIQSTKLEWTLCV